MPRCALVTWLTGTSSMPSRIRSVVPASRCACNGRRRGHRDVTCSIQRPIASSRSPAASVARNPHRQVLPELAQAQQHGQPPCSPSSSVSMKSCGRRDIRSGHGAFRHQPRHPAAERGLARAGAPETYSDSVASRRAPASWPRSRSRAPRCRNRSRGRDCTMLSRSVSWNSGTTGGRRLRHVDRAQRRRPALLQLKAEQVDAAVLLLHPLAVGTGTSGGRAPAPWVAALSPTAASGAPSSRLAQVALDVLAQTRQQVARTMRSSHTPSSSRRRPLSAPRRRRRPAVSARACRRPPDRRDRAATSRIADTTAPACAAERASRAPTPCRTGMACRRPSSR